jgi:hypothetical protein
MRQDAGIRRSLLGARLQQTAKGDQEKTTGRRHQHVSSRCSRTHDTERHFDVQQKSRRLSPDNLANSCVRSLALNR